MGMENLGTVVGLELVPLQLISFKSKLQPFYQQGLVVKQFHLGFEPTCCEVVQVQAQS